MTETAKEILNIVKNSINTEEKIFQYFVDNKINLNDLMELIKMTFSYKHFGYKSYEEWAQVFSSLQHWEQKEYLMHTMHKVTFDGKGFSEVEDKEILNPVYFRYLAEKSKKSRKMTEELISYIRKVCPVTKEYPQGTNYNILFHAMKFISINELKGDGEDYIWGSGSMVEDFFYSTNIKNSLYDLLTHLWLQFMGLEEKVVLPHNNTIEQLLECVCKEINKPYLFNIDIIENSFVYFVLMIESLINDKNIVTTTKMANTLRIGFGIVPISYYSENEYCLEKVVEYMNSVRKNVNKFSKELKPIRDYCKLNYDILYSQPNGYTCIYNTLFSIASRRTDNE